MKKKILAAVLTAVLALAFCTSVSAENTAQKRAQKWIDNGTVLGVGAGIADDDGTLRVTPLDGTATATVYDILAHLAAQYPKYDLVGGFSLKDYNEELDASLTVVVNGYKIKPSKSYILVRMDTSTGAWDTKAKLVSVSDGVAKFKITKPGPYALLTPKEGAQEATTPAASTEQKPAEKKSTTNNKPAPKTGEI